MTPEDEQALEHLAQERRREMFQRSLQAKLRAPAEPLIALKEKYAPVLKNGTWGKIWR